METTSWQWQGLTSLLFVIPTTKDLEQIRLTWLGFAEGEKPRLSLTLFPPPILREKLDLSNANQASQESSSPVKMACSPCARN